MAIASQCVSSTNGTMIPGIENWEFDEHGVMQRRYASTNDLPIKESERKYHRPLGRRPDDHPGLSDLGL